MPDLTIERLSLNLSGLSEEEGQRLARLIADGLANVSMAGAGNRDAMKATVSASPGAGMQELSQRIVADVVRQLDQSL
jgi:hypothetical protein